MKKVFSTLMILITWVSVIFPQSSLAIEKDCEVLKKYMQEVSIDCNMAIDEGLDLDDVIQKIKNDYDSVKFKNIKDKKNQKGIYPKVLAKSIRKVLSKELTYKNLHMYIKSGDYFDYMFDNQFVFISQVYFSKNGNEYFVEESNVRSIKKGMKYTGDEQSLFKVIHNGKELYRFAVFNHYRQKKAKISIENKIRKVPVKWIPNYVQNEEISFKSTEKTIVISITTCRPKDLDKYRKVVSEIRKILETTDKTVVIDLRNNTGGQIGIVDNILYSLLLTQNQQNSEYFSKILNNISQNYYELNTQTIRDRVLVAGNAEKFIRLKMDKNKYVQGYGSSDEIEKVSVAINNPKYNKNLYVLINNQTGSAGEVFALFTKKIYGNTILIGENSVGCVIFGDPYVYSLPNSEISIGFSATDISKSVAMISTKNWKGETYGIYPDIWATSEEIIDTMIYLTKDEELKNVLLSGKIKEKTK